MSIDLNAPGVRKPITKTIGDLFYKHINKYMASTGMLAFAVDLDDAEVKQAIKDAVDAAIQPLAAKRDELLGEVKKLRKESAIKPEDVEKLEAQIDELKNNLNAANANAKKFESDAKKAADALTQESTFNHKLLVENGLTDELTKAGVTNPAFLKAVKSTLAQQVKVVTEGEQRIAKAGDKTLSDFVKEWASSDEGKHFVSAPANNGGGAQGGGNNSNNQPKTSLDKIKAGLAKL